MKEWKTAKFCRGLGSSQCLKDCFHLLYDVGKLCRHVRDAVQPNLDVVEDVIWIPLLDDRKVPDVGQDL
jgi:hypothetical protein